jgi:hypothetical protein
MYSFSKISSIITFIFSILLSSCLNKGDEFLNETLIEEIIQPKAIRTTSNKYLINKEFGIHHPDSFLTVNPKIIDTLDIYRVKRIQTKTGTDKQYALIYHHIVSEEFNCYIVFDDYFGEAGAYLLITINAKGFVIDFIEFQGGDAWENGGYKSSSYFASNNGIQNTIIESKKNTNKDGYYLNSWTNKTKVTNYTINKIGKFNFSIQDEFIEEKDSIRRDYY